MNEVKEQRNGPILEVRNLKKYFPVHAGFLRRHVADVKAVDDVSFSVQEGETLGLVGESGCGKTTLGRTILRLYEPTDGQILFRDGGQMRDITKAPQQELKGLRRQIQMVFQDPNSSLSPRMTVQDIITEVYDIHNLYSREEREEKVAELMDAVGLPLSYRNRYPHQFSGGQRQRIGIARALALDPRLIILDEPVSALDVSVQAQILNLLTNLQREMKLTYVFISHDLSVVEHISDRVAVMYLGKIVEMGDVAQLYDHPQHPYTEALLSAVPVVDASRRRRRIVLEGGTPSPMSPPRGCHFHPRCRYAQENKEWMSICQSRSPELREINPGHMVSCHFAEELDLYAGPSHREIQHTG